MCLHCEVSPCGTHGREQVCHQAAYGISVVTTHHPPAAPPFPADYQGMQSLCLVQLQQRHVTYLQNTRMSCCSSGCLRQQYPAFLLTKCIMALTNKLLHDRADMLLAGCKDVQTQEVAVLDPGRSAHDQELEESAMANTAQLQQQAPPAHHRCNTRALLELENFMSLPTPLSRLGESV